MALSKSSLSGCFDCTLASGFWLRSPCFFFFLKIACADGMSATHNPIVAIWVITRFITPQPFPTLFLSVVLNSFHGSQLRRLQKLPRILFRAAVRKHSASRHQQLRSSFDDLGDRIVSNAAVYLNPIAKAQFLAKFFQAPNLLQRV